METISHTWHVLDVVEGSPADSAGLVPFGDYIIGWTGGPLQSEGDFFQLVEQSANTNLSLYVYNSDYDHTREVVIVPNRDWGGEGLLGCGIGYGLLRTCPLLTAQTESLSLVNNGKILSLRRQRPSRSTIRDWPLLHPCTSRIPTKLITMDLNLKRSIIMA